jgi:hypothetical protein
MNDLLSINEGFFRDNPIKLKWNSKGYFNILDGKHRVAFFIIKGLKNIPAKISRADYNQWLNPSTLKKINTQTKTNKFIHLLHPDFENTNNITHFYSQTLSSLIKFIVDKKHYHKKLSALCIGLDSIYFFQYFYKMGMRVQHFIKADENYMEAKYLNLLSYIDNNEIINSLPFTQDQEAQNYDIAYISAMRPDLVLDSFKSLLNVIAPAVASYFIIICKSENKNRIALELRNVHFNHYTHLGRVHTDEGQLNSILFSKNKLSY